jgi:hypothetical protein
MKKLLRISILLTSLSLSTIAQLPTWEELRTETKIGNFKTKSIENTTTWTDTAGNLWVFGGEMTNEDDSKTQSTDLWKFDSKQNNWKQITQIADNKEAIFPTTRREATAWTDPKGFLWLFGGRSLENELLNDLWLFVIEKNTWQQVHKNTDPRENSAPSPRVESAHWIDVNRNLWLFGGREAGSERNYNGFQNDLWCYNIEKKEWKLIEPKQNQNNEKHKPDPRIQSANFLGDESKLILFGGLGESKTRNYFGGYSDIWIYNIKENIWHKKENEKAENTIEIYEKQYGVSGFENPETHPGFRIKPSYWQDKEGFCWLYGGQTIITSESINSEPYIWRLNSKSNLWSYFPIENDLKHIKPLAIFENSEGKITIFAPQIIDDRAQITPTNNLYILNNFQK